MLPQNSGEQVPFTYALYQRTDEAGLELAIAAGFKRTFCTSVNMDFVGVWSVIRRLRVNDRALTRRPQGHCRKRWFTLYPQSPIYIRELGSEGVQTRSIFGRGTQFQK